MFTILKRSVGLADKWKLPSVVIVYDMAIYIKAQEIRWADNELYDRTILRLGEFHTCMSFLAVLGKRFRDAGLLDTVVESGIVAHGSVNAVLEGRHYNRAVATHKIVFEALERLRWQAYLETIETVSQQQVAHFAAEMINVFPSNAFDEICHSETLAQIVGGYEHYCDEQSKSSKSFFHFGARILK